MVSYYAWRRFRLLEASLMGLGIGLVHCLAFVESEDGKLLAACYLLDERLSGVKSPFRDVIPYSFSIFLV